MNTLELIRSASDSFSKSEAVVANYLLAHPQSSNVLSISDLAISAGVSEATVVRFTKKLGFKGFIDFKRAILQELLQNSNGEADPIYEEIRLADDPGTVVAKLLCLHKQTIDATSHALDRTGFAAAAEAIANSMNVVLYGHGGSGCIAQSAMFQFLTAGIQCSARVDETIQERSAGLLQRGHVVIALSHSGETPSLIQAVRIARRHHALTIAITNDSASSLAREADISLCTSVARTAIGAEAGAVRIAQMAILDALIVAATLINKQRSSVFATDLR